MLRPTSRARLRLLSALALFTAALAGLPAVRRASAVDPSTPLNQRVLVVYNSNVPESLEVADHYVARRQIPASRKCAVAPPGAGFISWADYLSTVRAPDGGQARERRREQCERRQESQARVRGRA